MAKINNIQQMPLTPTKENINRKSFDIRNTHRLEFDKCVNKALDSNLKISAHASERLQSRNINLSKDDVNSINKAIDKVQNKGAKETLILYNDLALIASVPNRTIITAMDKTSLEEKIFTNIDSAIII
ncbi:MAG: TIGR02530 family flagellar biosynthesis protein [Clostridium sp.]|uniref:TIGR02530 family flagellar biosynthesis protein n=1 Tax=Clostridium sp. TaxID=1506 RepID=UPI002FC6B9FD